MRSNSLDNKLRAKEVELKRHEQEIADQDEVWYFMILSFFCDYLEKKKKTIIATIIRIFHLTTMLV